MTKRILNTGDYYLDAVNGAIIIYGNIDFKDIFLIISVSTNEVLYNQACDGCGGTFSGKTLTLEKGTSGESNGGELTIIYFDDDDELATTMLLKENNSLLRKLIESMEINNMYMEEGTKFGFIKS